MCPSLACSSLWMSGSRMPSSAGTEHSVFLKAGFTGLGDIFQINPHPLYVGISRGPQLGDTSVPLISNLQDHQGSLLLDFYIKGIVHYVVIFCMSSFTQQFEIHPYCCMDQ